MDKKKVAERMWLADPRWKVHGCLKGDGFCDTGGGARLSRFAGTDLAALPTRPGPQTPQAFARRSPRCTRRLPATKVPLAPRTR